MASWWNDGVIYQIYPRSFADASGDGVGDLDGITTKLEYLAWLGVDALWLSPIFPSPMADFGYDVADYCDIDPLFGDLAAIDRLIGAAHERGLKVLLDWVPNHTSKEHPWFIDSQGSRTSRHRAFYIWRDPAPGGGPPNNWVRAWSDAPAWTFDVASGQYYLHCFLPEQPDLNWANPEVRDAMADTLRFWLARGIDGFRMDVIHLIGKDPNFADDPADLAALSHVPLNDRPETHEYLREIRAVLDETPDAMAVGEVYLLDPARVATYSGNGGLQLNFNFDLLFTPWRANAWREALERNNSLFSEDDRWPTLVLNNHDNKRLRSRVGGSLARAKVAAALLLTARGTPFLYAGEELGLLDAEITKEVKVDPGGRDGCRAPLPWDETALHGWPALPWLPFPASVAGCSVEAQMGDPASMLSWYRALLELRKHYDALQHGSMTVTDAPDGVVAFERRSSTQYISVMANFTAEPIEVAFSPRTNLAEAGEVSSGHLGPNAVVIRLVS